MEAPDEPPPGLPLRVASGPSSGDPFSKPDAAAPAVAPPDVLAAPLLEPAIAPGAPELWVGGEDELQAARTAMRATRVATVTSLDMRDSLP